jgi:flagellar biosynthesis/type III secretory pathway M-ring protein FliF/YscJ
MLHRTDILLARTDRALASMLAQEKYRSQIKAQIIDWSRAEQVLENFKAIIPHDSYRSAV